MCLRSIFLLLRVLFASLHLSSFLESRVFRQKDASKFWSFRKLMSSRATREMWWTTTTTKSLTWMTTIVRIVFNVVVYLLIVVVWRISSAINVSSRKLFVFWYVLNSYINVSLFNSRKFRFVFVSSFISCLTFVSLYASTRYYWRHLWKNDRFYNFIWLFEIVSEMTEKMLTKLTKKQYELMRKICFLWEISRTRFASLLNKRF
jgi:hypothetical protein